MRLIARAGLTISPWPNLAGRKADIAAGPGWLVAFAFLDADAPFSDYSGHDRTITLAEGPGFSLSGAGHADLMVAEIGRPAPFDGGWPAQCRIGGACVVVNTMTERAIWRHAITIHRGANLAPLDPSGAEADIVVVLQGSLTVGEVVAGRHDAIRLDGPAAPLASPDALLYRTRVLAA